MMILLPMQFPSFLLSPTNSPEEPLQNAYKEEEVPKLGKGGWVYRGLTRDTGGGPLTASLLNFRATDPRIRGRRTLSEDPQRGRSKFVNTRSSP